MRTFEEQLIFDVTGVKTEMFTNYSNFATDKIELTKIIRLAYNKAVDDCIENAELIEDDGRCDPPYCYIDKESMLKLKKDVLITD